MANDRPTPAQSEFLTNPGSDWIAVDVNGNILCRAPDEAAVRHAAPTAYWYGPIVPVAEAVEIIETVVPATADPVGFAFATLDDPAEIERLDLPQLDHDGDGEPGGSLPGAESTSAKGAAKKRKAAQPE